jgi:hypothetical protein
LVPVFVFVNEYIRAVICKILRTYLPGTFLRQNLPLQYMNRKVVRVISLASILIVLSAAVMLCGCTTTTSGENEVSGTVTYIPLEGGFYGIAGDDGNNYYPVNLEPYYQKNGTRIVFTFVPEQDVATTAMWGIPVRITTIRTI